MRILHILNHVKDAGNGIVNTTVDLACTQSQNGHKVFVASSGGQFEGLLSKFNVKHYKLEQTRKLVTVVKAAFTFRTIINECKPDVVHAQMMTGAIFAKALRIGKSYRIVTTVHNEFAKLSNVMKLGDHVIAVSEAVAHSLVQRGFDAKKVKTVLNGTLNSPRFLNSTVVPKELHRPSIVTVAGMFYRKGIPELIQAFENVSKHYPEAHLYIVGDGRDRRDFETVAHSMMCSQNIHFEGFQSDPREYLMSADVFVLASHKDPCPLVLIEARAASCAIVATNVDGIPEILDDGAAGVLVQSRDSSSLANEIERLLSNPLLLNEMKIQAKNNIDRFTVQRVFEDTMRVYNS